jgi:crotonobetainyl-CoA:carnitine CoA-transferase CaiB-like acyl-CoA transferase
MALTGEPGGPPTKVGVPITDLLAGMYGAFGVVSALHERERTGRGQLVRTSLLAAAVGVHAFQGTRWTIAGEVPTAIGNHHPSIAPYGLFRTADHPIQIACGSEGLWRAFAPLVGLAADDPRFQSNGLRVEHRAELTEVVEAELAGYGSDHWLATLGGANIPAGKVRTIDDVYRWEQTRSQGLLIDVDDPVLGSVELPGPPLRFGSEGRPARATHTTPPRLGQDDGAIRRWLDELDGVETGGSVPHQP